MRTISEILKEDRTCYKFLSAPVDIKLLHEIYDQVKFGPTSANGCPLRILFCSSKESREKILTTLSPGNVDHTKSAPVTAIMAYDTQFFNHMDKLFGHNPGMKTMFANNVVVSEQVAVTNAWLQVGYFILAARGMGLDCGPMGGFNKDMVNELFLSGTTWKSIVLCNLGLKDTSNPDLPRLPRLDFDEACRVI